jgi:kumamolisin
MTTAWLLNAKIYPLLGTSNLRDITVGTNGAYNAGSGYDLVTGIGVPVVNILKITLVGP